MTVDPRKTFTVKNCPRNVRQQQNDQGKRKSFLDSITKLGDLEVLNDTGFGPVAEGLRTLSKVSDSVRVGESVVPGREGSDIVNSAIGTIANTALDSVDQGAQAVLDATGLGGAVDVVGEFHPDVANRAVGQAKQIFERVKQGNFNLEDIPSAFQDLQNLEQLARGIFPTSDTRRNQAREFEVCAASPYAVDLIAHAPKFNFLFIIDVTFAPPYQDWTNIGSTMAFVVKRSTRPSVEFEYEEVNMYNFWTRVPKKVTYPPVTMTFYDDNKNAAHLFYTAYMRAMSPIANQDAGLNKSQTNMYEQSSMDFEKLADAASFTGTAPTLNGYSSSLGPLLDNAKSIVERIRLFHVFDYGRLMNVYNFHNPRILQFTPSDLNMAETGDGAEFEFQFAYDSMFIEPGFAVQDGGQDGKDITELTRNRGAAIYPIKPVFDESDSTDKNSQQSLGVPSAQEQAKGSSNAAASAIANTNNFTRGVSGAVADSLASTTGAISRLQQATGDVGSTFIPVDFT